MKPKLKDIKYIGTMMGKEAWGDENAGKIIKWYQEQLHEQMEKNVFLEEEKYTIKTEPSWIDMIILALKRRSIK